MCNIELEGLTNAERAQRLVENPEIWGQLVEVYESPLKTYHKLRNAASSKISFDEYIQLLGVCIEKGGERVRETVEERIPRSIKNQVLKGSPRGKAYGISTLREVDERLAAYAMLDVEVPSLSEESAVILEHLLEEEELDNHERVLYLRVLLEALPDDTSREDVVASVALISRARLVLEASPGDTVSDVFDGLLTVFADAVVDPFPDESRAANALVDEADGLAFDNERKKLLYLSAISREPRVEWLVMYVFLTARAAVERDRHHGMSTERGELLLAKHQFNLLTTCESLPLDRVSRAYLQSYTHLVDGIQHAGGKWLSAMDHRKRSEPEYDMAAVAYASAAYPMREVAPDRAAKFMSMAFRHLAHHFSHRDQKIQVHSLAIEFCLHLVENGWEFENPDLIPELTRIHKFRLMESKAWAALYDGEFDQARACYAECDELHGALVQTEISTDIEMLPRLIDGREAELDGRFDDAKYSYRIVPGRGDAIVRREQFVEIKSLVSNGQYEDAIDQAVTVFGEDNLITYAVRGIQGSPVGDEVTRNWGKPIELIRGNSAGILYQVLVMSSKSGVDLSRLIQEQFTQL